MKYVLVFFMAHKVRLAAVINVAVFGCYMYVYESA
jgi:hypothetical protein